MEIIHYLIIRDLTLNLGSNIELERKRFLTEK